MACGWSRFKIQAELVSPWLNILLIGVAPRALWGGVATYILSFGLTKTAFKLNLGVFLIIIPTYIIFGRSIVSFNVIYLIQVLLLLSLGWWVYYRKYLDLTEYFLPVFSIVFVLIACVNISRILGLILAFILFIHIGLKVLRHFQRNDFASF